MKEQLEQGLRHRLQRAAEETSWEAEFEAVYVENGETCLSFAIGHSSGYWSYFGLGPDGLEVIGEETDFGHDRLSYF